MPFCVECGREGPTIESLCADDFLRKRKLVRLPERVTVVRCAHCGNLHVAGRWVPAKLEEVLPDLIAAHAEPDPRVDRAEYAYDLRSIDERNVAASVRARCRVGPWDLVDSVYTTVHLASGSCATCSKRKGRYYAGTVQIRAEGRSLAAEEVTRAQDLIARSRAGGEEFVSRVDEVRGGFDVLVSSNAYAKRLANELAKTLGGAVGSSATLHTQREGREVYRSTYVVRLPGFREGDLVEWRGGRYRVRALGDPVRLEHAETGERVRVQLRDLRRARIVQS